MGTKKRIQKTKVLRLGKFAVATVLSISMILTFAGCGSSSSSSKVSTATASTIRMEENAKNSMVNDSLQVTITGTQRRPVSIFSGYTMDGESSGMVDSTSSDYVVIEVDMNIEFNQNVFSKSSTDTTTPQTLKDLLQPGSLTMIQGKDASGGDYTAYDVIVPGKDSSNSLSIESNWNYDLLNSELPVASQTKQGSILFVVSPLATDLQLVFVTADNNPEPLDAESVSKGNKDIYILPLT